jgi:hypothetical protein
MRTFRISFILFSVLCSTLLGGEISSAEYTDGSQQTIRVTLDGKQVDLAAPEGKFWNHLIVCKSKKMAFFVLNRGNPKQGSWIEDLYTFSADAAKSPDNPAPIPLKTELDEAKIMKIFDAADDGSRLLVELHYSHKKDANSTSYRTYPYFVDTQDGTLTPVKP